MSIISQLKETKYRLQMRQALQKASIEELYICKEELHKEFQRRNKKNSKWQQQ